MIGKIDALVNQMPWEDRAHWKVGNLLGVASLVALFAGGAVFATLTFQGILSPTVSSYCTLGASLTGGASIALISKPASKLIGHLFTKAYSQESGERAEKIARYTLMALAIAITVGSVIIAALGCSGFFSLSSLAWNHLTPMIVMGTLLPTLAGGLFLLHHRHPEFFFL